MMPVVLVIASAAWAPLPAQDRMPRDAIVATRAAARTAQREFESLRRARLPVTYGGTPECQVTIGRICYWDDNGDPPLPPEPERISEEREELLQTLTAAAERAPSDDWIAGQRVRYLIEAGRPREAAETAHACRGTAWWCAALRGLALHRGGDDVTSNAAFDTALAELPEHERCRWTDLSSWLSGKAASHYRRLDCAERESMDERIWWLAQPLAIHPGRDVRAELLSRRTMVELLRDAATPYTMRWSDDLATVLLRYGWPTSWARSDDGRSYLLGTADRSLIGHEPTPSFLVVPSEHAIADPTVAREEDWTLTARSAPMRYAPAYVTAIVPLAHQLARFRRGDSTLVVAAYDVGTDSAWRAHALQAALVLASSPDRVESERIHAGADTHGVLSAVVPSRPLLLSLELFAPDARRAARARYGLAPLAPSSVLSDILLLAPDATPRPAEGRLDEILPSARGTATVTAGDTVGLYWECYVAPTPAEPLSVSLRVVPTKDGWLHGLATALHLAGKRTPISLRWSDAGRPDRSAGRSLELGLRDLPPGHYLIELDVQGRSMPPASTTRAITVVSRHERE
jgi:hypothetical protein